MMNRHANGKLSPKPSPLMLAACLLLAAGAALSAQQPQAWLEYLENSSGDAKVVLEDGKELGADQLSVGQELPPGSTLVTYEQDYAEIRLRPSGSILRVSENTNFKIEELAGRSGAGQNRFGLAVGKVRAIVGGMEGVRTIIKGQTAVCGIRGTDAGMYVLPGQNELAFVLDGTAELTNSAGRTVAISSGRMADALVANFQAVSIPPAALKGLMGGVELKHLQKESVPGYERAAVPKPQEAAPEPAMEGGPVQKEGEGFLARFLGLMGFEAGSVTIGGQTYAKAILQPRLSVGKLKAAFYLPVLYQSNMLDPDDWYSPEGNDNEWSFGFDQSELLDGLFDFTEDLVLKIRYLEYGEQRDPFFFKLGNLHDITLGHGTIMRNYANDTDFPAIRQVGLNLGLNVERFGLEMMVNNAARPEIWGARASFRPMGAAFPLAFGLTEVIDFDPQGSDSWGRPVLLNTGLDVEYPLVENEDMSAILFTDTAVMIPYFRHDVGGTGISSGLATEAVWDGGNFRNWGLATGAFGKIRPLDWRLELRLADGSFRHAFYNALYDRARREAAEAVVASLEYAGDPDFHNRVMAVYGEAGYAPGETFYFKLGYLWPWFLEDIGEMPDDYLLVKAGMHKGFLPVSVSLSYERVRFVPTLWGEGKLHWFDLNTVISIGVAYPVGPGLDLAVVVSTNGVEDENGDLTAYPAVSVSLSASY